MSALFIDETRRSGYILFEAVAAMAVLSIGVFGAQSAIRQATLTRAQAADFTMARFLLEQVTSETEIQPYLLIGAEEGQFSGDYARFHWKREVSAPRFPQPELPPPPPEGVVNVPGLGNVTPPEKPPELKLKVPRLGKVLATVSWSRAGRPFEATAETLFNPDKIITPKTVDRDAQER